LSAGDVERPHKRARTLASDADLQACVERGRGTEESGESGAPIGHGHLEKCDEGAQGKENERACAAQATIASLVGRIKGAVKWPRLDRALHGERRGGVGDSGTAGGRSAGGCGAEEGSGGNAAGSDHVCNPAGNSCRDADTCSVSMEWCREGQEGIITPAPVGFGAAVATAWLALPQDTLPAALAHVANVIDPGGNHEAVFPAARDRDEVEPTGREGGRKGPKSPGARAEVACRGGTRDHGNGEGAEGRMGGIGGRASCEKLSQPEIETRGQQGRESRSAQESPAWEGGSGVGGGHGEDGGNPRGLAAHVGAVRAELASLLEKRDAWGAEREEGSAPKADVSRDPETHGNGGRVERLERAMELAMGALACLARADGLLQVVLTVQR
jgi:hypothetical protein